MRLLSFVLFAFGELSNVSAAEPSPVRFKVEGPPDSSQALLFLPAGGEPVATLKLEWLHSESPAGDATWNPGDRTTGHFKRDRAGITQTWFALAEPRIGVLHLRADKPGALGFRIVLQGGDAQVSERRRITVSTPLPGGRQRVVRAWVLPMESEVTPEERTIRVEGEGEALVLVTTAEAPEDELETALEMPLRSLGFGGAEMPDLSKVWRMLNERQKEEENPPSK